MTEPQTYPIFDEEWWELAGEIEDLARRIREAIDDPRNIPTFARLHPDKREAEIIRAAFSRTRKDS